MELRDRLFDDSNGRNSAKARLARFGELRSVSGWHNPKQGYGGLGALSVKLDMEVSKDALLSNRYDEVVFTFPEQDDNQERFSKVIAAVDVPIADTFRILGGASKFDGVTEFKERFIRTSSIIERANEFDRDDAVSQACLLYTSDAADE